MQFATIQSTQAIYDFQVENTTFIKKSCHKEMHIRLRRTNSFVCAKCGSSHVSAYPERERRIMGVPMGRCLCVIRVIVHRLRCVQCGARSYEKLPFLSSSKIRVTRQLERTIIELRREMSISAVATFYGLDWKTVKDIEKNALRHKYAKVALKNVKRIAIDEIYVFRKAIRANEKYVTVVRDLDTGAVLEVARGKGVQALEAFTKRIRKFNKNITLACMDMSNAYSAWVFKHLPYADIVYDHFHIIKAMNDKLDHVRRRVIRNMDENTRSSIKRKRFLFLRNAENLNPDQRDSLQVARTQCRELSDSYMLKETLRSIYAQTHNELDAAIQLEAWCDIAMKCNVPEMTDMAKTIHKHFSGILAYWRNKKASNASQEGFNNKIRWLISQAYGFHDYQYFRLKVFDLPSTNIKKSI